MPNKSKTLISPLDPINADPDYLVKLGDKLKLTRASDGWRGELGEIATVNYVFESDNSFNMIFDNGSEICMKPPTGPVMHPYGIPVEFKKVDE